MLAVAVPVTFKPVAEVNVLPYATSAAVALPKEAAFTRTWRLADFRNSISTYLVIFPILIYFVESTVSNVMLSDVKIVPSPVTSLTLPVTFYPLTYAVLPFTISSAVAVASLVSIPPEHTCVPVTFRPAADVKVLPLTTSAAVASPNLSPVQYIFDVPFAETIHLMGFLADNISFEF